MVIRIELEPCQAAALARLCRKFSHDDAARYLYPHVPKDLRLTQAYDMVHATGAIEAALSQAGVTGWPWIETGVPHE